MDILADISESFGDEGIDKENNVGRIIPITILSGFLGAGKTTLLRYILSQTTGVKIGVIVNDVAGVNIDAKRVKEVTVDRDNIETVQMENGCACCSASDDLFKSINKLLGLSAFDHIVVECSGVAEPKRLWALLDDTLEEEGLDKKVVLSQLVTVVDVSLFFDIFKKTNPQLEEEPTQRFVSDLLAEQIESADVIVINKLDMIDATGLDQVALCVAEMAPTAHIVQTEHGKIDIDLIFKPGGNEEASNIAAMTVDEEHSMLISRLKARNKLKKQARDDESQPTKRRKQETVRVSSFVYQRRLPFHPKQFAKLMISDRPDKFKEHVLRCKGYCWLANHCDMAMYYSQAGNHSSLTPIGAWWVHIPRSQWPSEQMPKEIMKDFQDPFGDRRQELVFIGIGMDQQYIEEQLDACLFSLEDTNALLAPHKPEA